MEKKALRNKIRQLLSEMNDLDYYRYSEIIADKLRNEGAIINAKTVALTISNKPEVDTYLIIEKMWGLNKRVVVPKCNPENRSMQFYEINHFSQLEKVYMDLLEPIPNETLSVEADDIDVIIVPGIVYDLKGYRIGYGGGYYDRYIVNYKGKLISIAFDTQIVDKVPKESHDRPVDMIITQTKIINCSNYRKGS
ncbi:5-formyltetrahydrofolate cyclo-ligase [Lysinibacillus sp. PLM2]|nr:5-formyltetrahydrofolate cyclo-ligase [Lysinibacillus sp. PLM2]